MYLKEYHIGNNPHYFIVLCNANATTCVYALCTLDSCNMHFGFTASSSHVQAVLASIIWVALYGMFLQFKDVWKYFKISFSDTVGAGSMCMYSTF